MNQYYSISQDVTYMIGEWEAGKEALSNIIEPKSKEQGKANGLLRKTERTEKRK